jgi:hypothetical protein
MVSCEDINVGLKSPELFTIGHDCGAEIYSKQAIRLYERVVCIRCISGKAKKELFVCSASLIVQIELFQAGLLPHAVPLCGAEQ